MASNLVVDYDIIINVQTIRWQTYDTEVNFDLANHSDFDVHVSLLYDVGEDEAEDYTGIRVGYPAGEEDRLGFITPPQSPRKFQEEKVSGLVSESAHTYIGDIAVSPTGTRRGIKQALVLQNPTGVMELSLTDSPIKNEIGKVFDATEWIDQVTNIGDLIHDVRALPKDTVFTSFDKLDFLEGITDDVVFNFEKLLISGEVILRYRDDKLHIKEAYVEFYGGLRPQSYHLYGVGDWIGAKSPLRLDFSSQHSSRKNFHKIKNQGSIRIYLLVKDRSVLTGETDYRWTSFDYGFGSSNWRSDFVRRNNYVNVADSLPGVPTYVPKESTNVVKKPSSDDTIEPPQRMKMNLSGFMMGTCFQRSFGTIIGGTWGDTIEPPQRMKMGLSGVYVGVSYLETSLTDYRNQMPTLTILEPIAPPQRIKTSITSATNFSTILASW